MLTAFGKRCSRPASLYDGLSRSDNIRPWDEPTHLIGADQKERECKYISSKNMVKILFTKMQVQKEACSEKIQLYLLVKVTVDLTGCLPSVMKACNIELQVALGI